MSELSEEKRAKLPAKEFGLPERARSAEAKKETGNYPMPDKPHAANAKARSTQQHEAGNLTKSQMERIHRKADKILDAED
jgi:trimethylamine:corrinoid methyltransferase-like protein